MPKRLTDDSLRRVLDVIRDETKTPRYSDMSLTFKDDQITVYAKGSVFLHGLCCSLPFGWRERRAVQRAFRKRHQSITEMLIRKGLDALRQEQQK